MIQKQIDAITKSDIDALIANNVNESKTLEYKQKLPGNSDSDKKEFLYDVSSFANASGGDILYGLTAEVDDEGKKTGCPGEVIPITGETADEAKLRLESMILSIKPRLRVQIQEITGWGDDGQEFVIVVRIPKSFASPHIVSYKGGSRFYSRHSSGKYQLDVGELRTAFLATESQAERIKQFRQDRLGKIIADETPVVLLTPHRLVLHMIPIAPFLNNERLDLSDQESLCDLFQLVHDASLSRYNLDGLLTRPTTSNGSGKKIGYCQLFFNGTVEMVHSDKLISRRETNDSETNGKDFFQSDDYERYTIESVQKYLKGFKKIGALPPVAISMVLLGCRGFSMYSTQNLQNRYPIDRDPILLPDVVIDNLDVNVPSVMKPIFDVIWNVCGYSRSFNYDENGNYTHNINLSR